MAVQKFDPDAPSPEKGHGGFNPECPACVASREHTAEEWAHHKFAGHGFTLDTGWTHKDLKPK